MQNGCCCRCFGATRLAAQTPISSQPLKRQLRMEWTSSMPGEYSSVFFFMINHVYKSLGLAVERQWKTEWTSSMPITATALAD
jgi:hypothetical protein